MTKLSNNIELKIEKSSQTIIEKFIEEVSDKLMINETYFGNLLLGINGMFSLMLENQPNTQVEIGYTTDYQYINIIFTGVSRETTTLFNKLPDEISENENLFTVVNLTDKITTEENRLVLVFYIGAMNHKIYDYRRSILNKYFFGQTSIKPHKSYD
jgi:hypothetical protein